MNSNLAKSHRIRKYYVFVLFLNNNVIVFMHLESFEEPLAEGKGCGFVLEQLCAPLGRPSILQYSTRELGGRGEGGRRGEGRRG